MASWDGRGGLICRFTPRVYDEQGLRGGTGKKRLWTDLHAVENGRDLLEEGLSSADDSQSMPRDRITLEKGKKRAEVSSSQQKTELKAQERALVLRFTHFRERKEGDDRIPPLRIVK